ncbi:creatinine amidohydrolase [Arboricoccus pini]|uniref:Creatinine amidohydrolase n=1 Tax=Arboricoccus pini TaxID=1963835 RepID=A0A212RFW4_9PROT|nr:creatininase [Arboricoccus pini]SNB71266.1 creatinine amidohydrolase [Arboricoccus pini]
MPARSLLADLTWYDFVDCVKSDPIIILPVGSVEQHGPHLPLSTDTLLPQALAEAVAERMGGLVAPPIAYGYKSQPKTGGGNHFPGTVSLDGEVLVGLVRNVINELARHGLRKIVLFDGHMENQWFLVEAADLSLRDQKMFRNTDLRIVKLGYWDFISKTTEELLFPDGSPSWELEHAAVMETSLMLHIRPDLVRRELIPNDPPAKFPPFDIYPFDTRPIPATGVLSPAASASAEKGAAVWTQVVADITEALSKAFDKQTSNV